MRTARFSKKCPQQCKNMAQLRQNNFVDNSPGN